MLMSPCDGRVPLVHAGLGSDMAGRANAGG